MRHAHAMAKEGERNNEEMANKATESAVNEKSRRNEAKQGGL